jgi:hypothetical protein
MGDDLVQFERLMKYFVDNGVRTKAPAMADKFTPQIVQEARDAADVQLGNGKADENGLYDDQIKRAMKIYPNFIGIVARDEVPKLKDKVGKHKQIGFILNMDKHNQPGSHWVAVYIDADRGSLEWYNSFGEPVPTDIKAELKAFVEAEFPSVMFKLKENKVKQQSEKSTNCGFFAMKFLLDRFKGKSFEQATGYDGVHRSQVGTSEAEIERLKSFPPFTYL